MGDAEWIPFRQYNIPSKDLGKDAQGCVAAVENVAIETARGPTFICCNDANKSFDGGAGLNASLAAYLMNADEDSYFGPGAHWNNAGWDGKSPRYRWHLGCILLKMPAISLLTGVFDDFPQLTKELGPPLAPRFARDVSA